MSKLSACVIKFAEVDVKIAINRSKNLHVKGEDGISGQTVKGA